MADYVPIHNPGNEITQTASATVTGGQVLMNSGASTVAPASAATTKYVGVAAHDAANGAAVTVLAGPGMVHETTAQGAITAGDLVITGTVAGTVATAGATPAANTVIGIAITSAADTALCKWKATR